MMQGKLLALCELAALVAVPCALARDIGKIDFHWNFKQRAAQTLYEKKDYPGAREAAAALVATAPDERAKMENLALQARCLAHEGQHEAAMEMAGRIDDKPLADCTRMEVFSIGTKPAELIAAFKDADLTPWPDGLAYKGFLFRGEAHAATENAQAAIGDFERCAERAGKDTQTTLESWNRVGALHEKLKNQTAALAAYGRVIEFCRASPGARGSHATYPGAISASARILTAQKKPEEALAVLQRYDVSLSPSYGSRIVENIGDLQVTLGRKDQALASYQEVLRMLAEGGKGKATEPQAARINRKIEALKK